MIELATKRFAQIRPSVLQSDYIACDEFNFMDRLAAIQKPTLVICGDEDQMTPLRNSQYLSTQIPNATLSIIPEAGHMVMLEKPHEVTNSIAAFIDENRWKIL